MIRRSRKSDAAALAQIHITELSGQFLPSLGKKFLILLYTSFVEASDMTIFVIEINNSVQGFIVGAKNFNSTFKENIIKNFLKYFEAIFPQLLKKPFIIANIFETFFYTNRIKILTPLAELVVIAISKNFQKKGLGTKLVSLLEKSFISQGIRDYKVSVTANNMSANSFYKKLGFKKISEFTLYGRKLYLYIKKIS